MIAPLVRPYITYEDLCRLPSDGHRYELYDGEAYVAPSPNSRHQRAAFRLAKKLDAAISDGSEVLLAPMDVVFGPATALQPDLMLILERNRDIVSDVVRGVPDLIVEVLSPSTEAIDRGLKMEIYARFGVAEYWLADADRKVLEIYRLDPEARAYRLVETCRAGARATTPLLPALSIDPKGIFRD
jgi:Uma2 family endonuclease